ncbi:MAG: hypothetical protein Q8N30_04260 [Methylococcales bacterium]|nr:hypothetical protein [Methylococcales bacterium]
MSTIKEKMINIIQQQPDDASFENALIEVLLELISESIEPFCIHTIENAGVPFKSCSPERDYSCFDNLGLNNARGVYIFQDKETEDVFYIGEAHRQDLKTCITQNYTYKNTGGTFRKNWMKKEGKSFCSFKKFLSDCTITTIVVNTDVKKLIVAVESLLIIALNPKYNKD